MRLLTFAAMILALALPSAALAQGAGDEQYQDPFGDEQSEQQEPTPTPAPTQAPVQPSQSQPAPAPAPSAPAPAQPAPQTGRQLPYTGAEAGWIALAGAVLLASGVALRRRADRKP